MVMMPEDDVEAWRLIPGFARYECSSLGRVRVERTGFMMKPEVKSGYLRVRLISDDSKSQARFVHGLVLLTFVGPCPEGQEARHRDDPTRTNCRLSNLEWGSKAANGMDRRLHGRALKNHLLGRVFGQLTVVERIYTSPRRVLWHCRCECGVTRNARADELISGKSWCCERCSEAGRARPAGARGVNMSDIRGRCESCERFDAATHACTRDKARRFRDGTGSTRLLLPIVGPDWWCGSYQRAQQSARAG